MNNLLTFAKIIFNLFIVIMLIPIFFLDTTHFYTACIFGFLGGLLIILYTFNWFMKELYQDLILSFQILIKEKDKTKKAILVSKAIDSINCCLNITFQKNIRKVYDDTLCKQHMKRLLRYEGNVADLDPDVLIEGFNNHVTNGLYALFNIKAYCIIIYAYTYTHISFNEACLEQNKKK